MQRRYGKMDEDNVFRGFHALKTSAYSPFAIRQYKEAADPSSDVLLHRIAAHGGLLQGTDGGFQAAGDFVGGHAGRKSNGRADANGNFAEMGKAAVFALHLPDAVESHGNHRDAQILCEQADAGLKRGHLAGAGVVHFAFGKDEHAVAAVDRFAGEAEAFAEAGKLRQRKNVEEQGGERVAELIGPAPGEEPITRRTTHVFERFAAHGRGEAVAVSRRQRGENQTDVGAARDVVRNDEDRSAQAAKILAAHDARVAEDLRGGPDERVIDRETQPANGFALRPARIAVFRFPRIGLLKKPLDLSGRFCIGEGRLVEFHVELGFQGAHELDTIEGRQRFQGISGSHRSNRLPCGEFVQQVTDRIRASGGSGRRRLVFFFRGQKLAGANGDFADARLSRRGAGKIMFGPDQPDTDSLILRESAVGVIDGIRTSLGGLQGRTGSVVIPIRGKQNGTRFSIAALFDRNHDAVANPRLLVQLGFEVFGVDVQSRWRDDDVFLSSAEAEIAFGVEFTEIAGAQPALLIQGMDSSLFPIARGNIFTADKNLAVFGKLEFTARENLADGALHRAKRMIQTDQRRGLGQAIALNDGIAKSFEKSFAERREGGATGDKSPELQSEPSVNPPEHPGAAEKGQSFRRKVHIAKRIAAAQISKFLKHGVDQCIEHAWNCDQSCGAFSLDGSGDFRRIAGSFENDRGSEERRNEQCHELAKDMAHRNERDEAQWVKPAFVLTIVIDAAFERLQVGQKIAVG